MKIFLHFLGNIEFLIAFLKNLAYTAARTLERKEVFCVHHSLGPGGRYLAIAGLAVVMGLSYELFVFPNAFAPAGINGFATIIQYLFHVSIGYLSLIINLR